MIRNFTLLFAFTLLVWAQDARTVIDNSLKSMGAANLKTIEYSGSGADFSLGQAQNNTSGWPASPTKPITA